MAKRKRKDKQMPWTSKKNPVFDDSDGLMDVYIGLLVESHVLADEPEFIDFRFDSNLAKASAEATLKEHGRVLQDAEKKGGEDLEYIQEKIFIETVDRLLTRSVRQEIMHRLNLLVNRLQTNKRDSNKLMIATALEVAFQGDMPWGLSNLMSELFKRSLQTMDPDPDIAQLLQQVEDEIGKDLSPEELFEKMNDPEFINEIEGKIDADSELFQKMLTRSDNFTKAFMDAIFHGYIELDIFTGAEVESYFDVVQEKMQAAGLDTDDLDSPAVAEIARTSVEDCIEDIITPERLKKMKEDLQLTLNNWSDQGNIYAAALFTEIRYLKDVPPVDNPFIRSLFLSQLQRSFVEKPPKGSKTVKKTKRGRRRRKKR